jgi:hypothetical protein
VKNQFNIRLNQETKQMLEFLAEKYSRSLTKEIEYLIKKEYQNMKGDKNMSELFVSVAKYAGGRFFGVIVSNKDGEIIEQIDESHDITTKAAANSYAKYFSKKYNISQENTELL